MGKSFEGIAFQGISRRAFLLSSGAAAVGVARRARSLQSPHR